MKFLLELLRFTRLDDEGIDDLPAETGNELTDVEGSDVPEDNMPPTEDQIGDEPELIGDEEPTDEFVDDMPEEPTEPEDPNRRGMIRTVKGAHLVYKREVEDGTYEELWIYNASTLRDEITIRKAVLAGTDIPVNKSQSPDGAQSVETWAAGNAELMLIRGLPQ